MSDKEIWTLESIVEFFREKFKDAETAVRLAGDDLSTHIERQDDRLDKIGEDTAKALLETRGREALFHTRIAHDEFVKVIDERFENVRKEIKPQWIVWISAAGVFVTATVAISTGIWTLGVMPIKDDIHRVETVFNNHIEEDSGVKQTQEKIRDQILTNTAWIAEMKDWVKARETAAADVATKRDLDSLRHFVEDLAKADAAYWQQKAIETDREKKNNMKRGVPE